MFISQILFSGVRRFKNLLPILLISVLSFSLSAQDKTRIVSLNGTVTEILFGLGVQSDIVGVDTSSYFPKEAMAITKIGYQRTLATEGILSLNPTQIIGTNYAGPPATIEQLKQLKVPMLIVPEHLTIEGAAEKIELIGKFVSKEKEAEVMIRNLRKQVAGLKLTRPKKPVKVLFLYSRSATNVYVSGTGNAITEFAEFKPLTSEAIVKAQPDIILIPSISLEGLGGEKGLWELPGIQLTTAGKKKNYLAMDDLLLLGFGPRIGTALEELSNKWKSLK